MAAVVNDGKAKEMENNVNIRLAAEEISGLAMDKSQKERCKREVSIAVDYLLKKLDEVMLVLDSVRGAYKRVKSSIGNSESVSADTLAAARNLKDIYTKIDRIGHKVAELHYAVEVIEKDVSEAEQDNMAISNLEPKEQSDISNFGASSALANVRAVGNLEYLHSFCCIDIQSQSLRSAQDFAKRMSQNPIFPLSQQTKDKVHPKGPE